MNISTRKSSNLPELFLDGTQIKDVKSHKHLGITLNSSLNWTEHIDNICFVSRKRLDAMRLLKYKLNRKSLETFYFSFIRPILEYGDVLFNGASASDLNKLDRIELEAMRISSGAISRSNTVLMKLELGWEEIAKRRLNHVMVMFFKVIRGNAPDGLINILEELTRINTDYNLRMQI